MMKLTDGFLEAISAFVKENGASDYAVLTLEPAGIAQVQTATTNKKPLASRTNQGIDLEKLASAIETLDTPQSSSSVLITMLTDAKEDASSRKHGGETFKDACLRMWKAGMNLDDIAAAMGVSALTISIALKHQLQIPRR